MSQTITSEFAVGDRLHIDGCRELIGVVTAIQWRHPNVVNYEVSWVDRGASMSPIIEGWRLSRADV